MKINICRDAKCNRTSCGVKFTVYRNVVRKELCTRHSVTVFFPNERYAAQNVNDYNRQYDFEVLALI